MGGQDRDVRGMGIESSTEHGDSIQFQSYHVSKHRLLITLQRFKQLPCLRDGDLELPQTGAMIRHLGRKLNLYGSGLEEQAMIDMLHEGYIDLREKLIEIVFTEGDFVSTTLIQIHPDQ